MTINAGILFFITDSYILHKTTAVVTKNIIIIINIVFDRVYRHLPKRNLSWVFYLRTATLWCRNSVLQSMVGYIKWIITLDIYKYNIIPSQIHWNIIINYSLMSIFDSCNYVPFHKISSLYVTIIYSKYTQDILCQTDLLLYLRSNFPSSEYST